MKPNLRFLTYLLTIVIGILLGALLFKGCGKAKVIEHWNTVEITDTVRLTVEKPIEIPKPYPVLVYRDTGSTKYVILNKDSLVFVYRDSIHGAPVIAAKEYKDSVRFSGNNASAVLHYDLISSGELLRMDYDIDLFSTKQCPDCPVPKKKYNVLGANFGYINNSWFVSGDITRKWIGFGGMYSLKDKGAGGYLRFNLRF